MEWLMKLEPGWQLRNSLLVVTDNAEARSILCDHHTFQQWDGDALMGNARPPADRVAVGPPLSRRQDVGGEGPFCFAQTPIFLDGPEHTRFRTLMVNAWQAAKATQRLRPFATALANRLISAKADSGPFEFMVEVALPMSCYTLATFFGDDPGHWLRLALSHPAIWGWDMDLRSGTAVLAGLQVRVWKLVAERHGDRRDDAISRMIRARDSAGRGLHDKEIQTLVLQMAFASNEGTVRLLGNVAETLADDIATQCAICVGQLPVSRLVTMVLAQRPPLLGIFRRTESAVDWNGTAFPADSGVFISILAANRGFGSDDQALQDPRRHLSFGAGIHTCPGAALATMQAEVIAEALCGMGHVRTTGRGQGWGQSRCFCCDRCVTVWSRFRIGIIGRGGRGLAGRCGPRRGRGGRRRGCGGRPGSGR